jgi:hypothetical protein
VGEPHVGWQGYFKNIYANEFYLKKRGSYLSFYFLTAMIFPEKKRKLISGRNHIEYTPKKVGRCTGCTYRKPGRSKFETG